MVKVKAYILSGKISSTSVEAQNLFEKERFGEKIGEKIVYSPVEAVYLVEKEKMIVLDNKDKELTKEGLVKRFEKVDKEFMTKFIVFKDLRKKGNIVKSALKFGAEFRVYEKGSNIGEAHAKWILFPLSEHKKISMQDFCAKNRIAHSTNKRLMIAIVDDEEDVSYYESRWLKL